MTERSLEKIKEDAEECLAHHGPDKFCGDYDCRTVLEVFTALEEAKIRVQELEDALKEQVEIAYRAGIEDGWENPDGNIENMTYEYLRYLEAKLWRETQRAKK